MTAPVSSTLIGSVNLGRTEGAASGRLSTLFDKLTVGQHLKLQVIRQLEQQRYEVAFDGHRHVVESRVPLAAGSRIEARVEAKHDQLELRYLSTERFADEELAEGDPSVAAAEADLPAVPPWLNELAEQYRVTLDSRSAQVIERSAAAVSDPGTMTRGGLFLQKLSQPVQGRDLESLYRALSDGRSGAPSRAPAEMLELPGNAALAATLADALDPGAGSESHLASQHFGGDGDAHDSRDEARRATQLLNLQDEGSVAWRYGTLPMLVGGRLIELDLVLFREREPRPSRAGLKRLVMTLDTTHFGRVQVEARAVDNRLIVKLRAPTADAVDVLSAYGTEVRAAIEQLGWSVDELTYELAEPARAARAVVDHVLSAGSVDQEL
jgi:hypothetical protein